ncbi:MAG TPA: amidase [Pyrinomonadaceae bacterium]|nr:amidase [Pyrinomonadaceae bacterium]
MARSLITFIVSNDLTTKSAIELVALISSRAVSPVEVVEAHLRRIEQVNPALNAIVTIAEDAIERARVCEGALMSGQGVGPLCGLPVTVKDTIDTAGLRTTSGSRIRAHHVPEQDAASVARLKAAGAIILGKTNVPEMAVPYETDNPVFGYTNNPHDLNRTAGGSSGGEAAAIAACLSPVGLGSDLSGSIRVPAHFCGIAGLKPTTGRVPMDGHTPATPGVVALGASIGPMARRVQDLALLFKVLAEPTQFEAAQNETDILNPTPLRGSRVAWYTDDGVAPVSEEIRVAVQNAAKALAGAGLEVIEVTPPGISKGSQLWIDLFSRAANSEIAALYRGREVEAGPQVARLLREFDHATADFQEKIEKAERLAAAVLERERMSEGLLQWMRTTGLILAPVGATVAFEHGAERVEVGGKSISVFRAFSYSQTFNVLGLPSATVPAGRTANGLPIGVQVVGRPFEERSVLSAAGIIEAALGVLTPPAC